MQLRSLVKDRTLIGGHLSVIEDKEIVDVTSK